MTDKDTTERNIGLAFDGGGVRGLIPAIALEGIEDELGSPIIDHPDVKVLIGTSTGAIIAAALAVGCTAQQIQNYYRELSQVIFPRWNPGLSWAEKVYRYSRAIFLKSMYKNDLYKTKLNQIIKELTSKDNFTLGDLNEKLAPKEQKLIITTMNVIERRTVFLKTSDESDADWLLSDALIASSAAPTFLPVFVRGDKQYVDGGAGNYNNPAYIAAAELFEWSRYLPQTVHVWSFGTGYVPTEKYKKVQDPHNWSMLEWVKNTLGLLMSDATKTQSRDVFHDFFRASEHIDAFRRYQVSLDDDISLDDSSDKNLQALEVYGQKLLQQVREKKFAPHFDDLEIDPEEIAKSVRRYDKGVGSTAYKHIEGSPQNNNE